MIKPITEHLARQLVAELREIHARWEAYAAEPSVPRSQRQHCNTFTSGICHALYKLVEVERAGADRDTYLEIGRLLQLAEDGWVNRVYLNRDFDDWQPRAFMCLFLAEWIETEILA